MRRVKRALCNLYARKALSDAEIVKELTDYVAAKCPEVVAPERKPGKQKAEVKRK
ncbi:MAG: hypothetical protein M0R66_01155 [Candidatus Omnitrophica bacterium]|nr:hypothetical protein [Candidatus Omnitrophota bacterium]